MHTAWKSIVIVALITGGCAKHEIPPAEKFVRSRLPGDFKDLTFHQNGNVICGLVGDAKTGKFQRFFANANVGELVYQRMESYKFTNYANACELKLTEAQIAEQEERDAQDRAAEQMEAQRAIARQAREQWMEKNGEAIKSLHDAAQILQNR